MDNNKLILFALFGLLIAINAKKSKNLNPIELNRLNLSSPLSPSESLRSSELQKIERYDSLDIVETLSGKLKGKRIKVFGQSIYAFVGIRYARPPIGNLRFAKPQPIKWDGVRDAIRFTKLCPQNLQPKELSPVNYISEKMSEDCLSLNIWTPELRPKTLRTVMVWIHGGGYNYLTANLHETDGRVLAQYGDVVVVTINYRVSSFGFLDTGIEDAPGNMGLYDQSFALNWIKDNIKDFGGDPQMIVPFGHSAGSISVGMQMLIEKSNNLFSRAIMQSGAPLVAKIMFAKSRENAEKLAIICKCSNKKDTLKTNPKKVVKCLKNLPMVEVLKAEREILNTSFNAFTPTINGVFKDIPPPLSAIEDSSTFSNMKELLFGLVPDEGSVFLHGIMPNVYGRNTIPELNTLKDARNAFIKFSTEKNGIPLKFAKLTANSIIGPERDTPINNVRKVYTIVGDNTIACPTIYWADEFVKRNKTIFGYFFNHRAKANANKHGEWQGVIHYEEVPFVFGYPLRRKNEYSNDDIELSKRLMHIWTHFAKTGRVPNQFELQWPLYNINDNYMVLEPNKSSLIQGFHKKNCEVFKASVQLLDKIKS